MESFITLFQNIFHFLFYSCYLQYNDFLIITLYLNSLKDGKPLKLDDRVRVVYESKEVLELILDHVVAKDAGTYTVVATNIEGEDKTVGNLSVVSKYIK